VTEGKLGDRESTGRQRKKAQKKERNEPFKGIVQRERKILRSRVLTLTTGRNRNEAEGGVQKRTRFTSGARTLQERKNFY